MLRRRKCVLTPSVDDPKRCLLCFRLGCGLLFVADPAPLFLNLYFNPGNRCIARQPRAVHDISGTNWFVQARRTACLNPRCPLVKERLAQKVHEREKEGDVPKIDSGNLVKRDITAAEMEVLRDGNLDGMEPVVARAMVAAFLRRGVGFSTNTPE